MKVLDGHLERVSGFYHSRGCSGAGGPLWPTCTSEMCLNSARERLNLDGSW